MTMFPSNSSEWRTGPTCTFLHDLWAMSSIYYTAYEFTILLFYCKEGDRFIWNNKKKVASGTSGDLTKCSNNSQQIQLEIHPIRTISKRSWNMVDSISNYKLHAFISVLNIITSIIRSILVNALCYAK